MESAQFTRKKDRRGLPSLFCHARSVFLILKETSYCSLYGCSTPFADLEGLSRLTELTFSYRFFLESCRTYSSVIHTGLTTEHKRLAILQVKSVSANCVTPAICFHRPRKMYWAWQNCDISPLYSLIHDSSYRVKNVHQECLGWGWGSFSRILKPCCV